MQNPLESEDAAFRFVLGALVYFAPIVVAAAVATWLGVIAFVAMSALAFVVLRRRTASVAPVASTGRAAVDDTRRILAVTDTLPVGPLLREAILRLAEGAAEDVLLIFALAPSGAAEGTGVGGLWSGEELETALHDLRTDGINARGSIADGDPLDALEETLRGYDADEVVISVTTSSSAEGVAERARSLFDGHVTAIDEKGRR